MSAQPFQDITISGVDKTNFPITEDRNHLVVYTLSGTPEKEWIAFFDEDIQTWRNEYPDLPIGTMQIEGDKLKVAYSTAALSSSRFKKLYEGLNESIKVANAKYQRIAQADASFKELIINLLREVGL